MSHLHTLSADTIAKHNEAYCSTLHIPYALLESVDISSQMGSNSEENKVKPQTNFSL